MSHYSNSDLTDFNVPVDNETFWLVQLPLSKEPFETFVYLWPNGLHFYGLQMDGLVHEERYSNALQWSYVFLALTHWHDGSFMMRAIDGLQSFRKYIRNIIAEHNLALSTGNLYASGTGLRISKNCI